MHKKGFRVILWRRWTRPAMWHQRWQSVSQEFVCACTNRAAGLFFFTLNGLGVNVVLRCDAPVVKVKRGARATDAVGTQTHWHLHSLRRSLLSASSKTYVHVLRSSQSSASFPQCCITRENPTSRLDEHHGTPSVMTQCLGTTVPIDLCSILRYLHKNLVTEERCCINKDYSYHLFS